MTDEARWSTTGERGRGAARLGKPHAEGMPMSDRVDVLGWYRFDDNLTSSRQPNEAQLAEIAAFGVSHVVNLG